MSVSRTEIETCLRVLAAADGGGPAAEDAETVTRAVAAAYRTVKKRRKADRAARVEQHDRALRATATRYIAELPDPAPEPVERRTRYVAELSGVASEPTDRRTEMGRQVRARRRYMCKQRYPRVDPEYHLMCPECDRFNASRRVARCDLRGRRAVVTGGRVHTIGSYTRAAELAAGTRPRPDMRPS